MVADLTLDKKMLQDVLTEILRPAVRLILVREVQVAYRVAECRACRVLGFARSSFRYRSRRAPQAERRVRLRDLATSRVRFEKTLPRKPRWPTYRPTRWSEGARQAGLRYNSQCLSDGEVDGGVLSGLTLGLNWLLNPNARVYLNDTFTYRDFHSTPYTKDAIGNVIQGASSDGSGGINGFGARLSFDF